MENRIALIGVIVEDREQVASVNNLLHQHADSIVGRMGLPHREREISIISIVMDAPESTLSTLAGQLGQLPGVSVKTMLAKN